MFIIDDLIFWLPLKTIRTIAQKVKELSDQEIIRKERENIVKKLNPPETGLSLAKGNSSKSIKPKNNERNLSLRHNSKKRMPTPRNKRREF